MNAADAIRSFITPLLPDWEVQFGEWRDSGPTKRYAVLKPAGGARAELVRRPQFTLSLVGQAGGDVVVPSDAANNLVEAMRNSSGDLVFMQPGEPVYIPTADRRPVFEIAISTITT